MIDAQKIAESDLSGPIIQPLWGIKKSEPQNIRISNRRISKYDFWSRYLSESEPPLWDLAASKNRVTQESSKLAPSPFDTCQPLADSIFAFKKENLQTTISIAYRIIVEHRSAAARAEWSQAAELRPI